MYYLIQIYFCTFSYIMRYTFFILLWCNILHAQKNHDSTTIHQLITQSKSLKTSNAILVAQKALSLSQKLNNINGIIASSIQVGSLYNESKSLKPALIHFENILPLLRNKKDEYTLGQILKKIGDIYQEQGFMRQSFESYREAAVLLRNTNQLKLLNECQDALGNIVLNFGNSYNAINFYKRSLTIKSSLNDWQGVVNTNEKISKIYLQLKQYDSALFYNKEVQRLAINTTQKIESRIDEMIILCFKCNLAEAFELKNKLELVITTNNEQLKLKMLTANTNYYLALNDKVQASKYYDSAAALIQASKNTEFAISSLSMLAEMSSSNEDYKTAYNMYKNMDKYKDMFRTEYISRISAEIKNTAETNLNKKEIEYLSLANKLKQEQLSKDELQQMALLRENILKDSSLQNQQLLMATLENESKLQTKQLIKEKELRQSLTRENTLKQKLLTDEKRNKKILLIGLTAMAILGSLSFIQYKKQRNKNEIINKQSAELKVLNKEIHHRVKNNLQIISSMLDLQSQSLNDEKATAIIKEGIQRVQSMAFIHQNLYQENVVNAVNMQAYIKTLSIHLFQTYNIQPNNVQLITDIDNLNLHTETAIPLGMILNELISNSLKYAFKHTKKGAIWVIMKFKSSELLLQVKDNGDGLPTGFKPENNNSFGYELVKAFSQKLKARINIDGTNGTDVQIIISKFKTID